MRVGKVNVSGKNRIECVFYLSLKVTAQTPVLLHDH